MLEITLFSGLCIHHFLTHTMPQDDLHAIMRNFEKLHNGERTFHITNNTLSRTALTQQPSELSMEMDNLPVEALKEKLSESNTMVNELMWRINSMNLEIDKVNKKTCPKLVFGQCGKGGKPLLTYLSESSYHFHTPCFSKCQRPRTAGPSTKIFVAVTNV